MDGECAVSQLASAIGPHYSEAGAAGNEARIGCKKAMVLPACHHCGPRGECGGKNLLGKEMIVGCAITQLTIAIVTHHPEGAARQEKTMQCPRGSLLNAARENLLWNVGLRGREADPQFTDRIVAHDPQTAIRLRKKTVRVSTGDAGHGWPREGRRQLKVEG